MSTAGQTEITTRGGDKENENEMGRLKERNGLYLLNLELAKDLLSVLNNTIVHEMVHLLEQNQHERFIAYMNKYLPN